MKDVSSKKRVQDMSDEEYAVWRAAQSKIIYRLSVFNFFLILITLIMSFLR